MNAKEIQEILIKNGFECYIVGGAIRDHFLNTIPKDFDLFTSADSKQIKTLFSNAKIMGNRDRQQKLSTFTIDETELSSYRGSGDREKKGNNIQTHCKTCDFTINAMAGQFINNKIMNIIDFHSGKEDLNNKIIRFVGDPNERILEDPLRILRALRFASKLNFNIEEKSSQAIRRNFYLLQSIPIERIREEFIKILSTGNINILFEYPFMAYFIPELSILSTIQSGGKFHNETPLQHSINAFKLARETTQEEIFWLLSLFHDTGKAFTLQVKSDGNHFYGHDLAGYRIVKNIFERFKFPKEYIDKTILIKHHMFGYFNDNIKPKTYLRMLEDLKNHHSTIEELILLQYFDYNANEKNDKLNFMNFLNTNTINKFLLKHFDKPTEPKNLVIDGNIIKNYGFEREQIREIQKEIILNIWENRLENTSSSLINFLEKRRKKNDTSS